MLGDYPGYGTAYSVILANGQTALDDNGNVALFRSNQAAQAYVDRANLAPASYKPVSVSRIPMIENAIDQDDDAVLDVGQERFGGGWGLDDDRQAESDDGKERFCSD